MSVVLGMFSITVHKYVPGEENDAKLLFSGDVISDEFYNMETGQIEDFWLNDNPILLTLVITI